MNLKNIFSPIFVLIAGIAKAIMDTLQFHFSNSIFANLNKQWFDPSVSWENKYTMARWFPDTFTDCWHESQAVFLFFIFAAMIFFQPIFNYWKLPRWVNLILDLILLRAIFGFGFVLFYNFLLVKK